MTNEKKEDVLDLISQSIIDLSFMKKDSTKKEAENLEKIRMQLLDARYIIETSELREAEFHALKNSMDVEL